MHNKMQHKISSEFYKLQDVSHTIQTNECDLCLWGETEAGLPKQLANFVAMQIHIQNVIQNIK
jgi:hypothetical protein